MEYVQRHEAIAYDGTNAAAVVVFLDGVGGLTWAVDTEIGEHLVIQASYGGEPAYQVEMDAGDRVTKYTTAEYVYMSGPWTPTDFAAAFTEVPTAADFADLAQRVTDLESP